MTLEEIDRSGEVWEYRPSEHKLEHKGIERVIYIGSEGQKILLPYLNADPAQHLFESRLGKPYTEDSYCRAVTRACKRANVDSWSPNQLRHTAATEIRKRFGLEASRVILGHTTPSSGGRVSAGRRN